MVDIPRKRKKQSGLAIRMKPGDYIPIVVRQKSGDITIRIGKGADGRCIIDAPKATCDIILPERRP